MSGIGSSVLTFILSPFERLSQLAVIYKTFFGLSFR
ncbi:uncharacterized protein METZ01_LOCUS310224 [marine metagenome]|uniref:Uncharacterized protein n=1 Tax=marine metagenome TaxID=408172 RepID=A0A382N9H3_9ZZZZ